MRTRVAAGIAAIAFVAAGLFVWDHSPPMEFVGGSVLPEVITPGKPITVSIDLNWRRLCELNVTRILRDGGGDEHKLPWAPSSPPKELGKLNSKRVIIVPSTAKYGRSCYRATIYMHCGLVDRLFPIKIEIPCIPFEIVAP